MGIKVFGTEDSLFWINIGIQGFGITVWSVVMLLKSIQISTFRSLFMTLGGIILVYLFIVAMIYDVMYNDG